MPKLITNWDELEQCETDKYYIEVNKELGNGYVRCKDKNSNERDMYLSTHTFYGGVSTKSYNLALKRK